MRISSIADRNVLDLVSRLVVDVQLHSFGINYCPIGHLVNSHVRSRSYLHTMRMCMAKVGSTSKLLFIHSSPLRSRESINANGASSLHSINTDWQPLNKFAFHRQSTRIESIITAFTVTIFTRISYVWSEN